VHLCELRAGDVEGEELDEEDAPGMDGVERRDDECRGDAEGRQLLAAVCTHRQRGDAAQRPQTHLGTQGQGDASAQ